MKKTIQQIELVDRMQRVGLSHKEAVVYVAVLELGGAVPSRVASYCRLNRSTVYKVLVDLSVRGLVTELTRKNKLYYQAEQPDAVRRYAKSQIKIAKDRLSKIETLMPEIEGLFALVPDRPTVRYFDGVDGVIRAYEDHISVDEPYEMLGLSNVTDLMMFLPRDFVQRYVQEKVRRKVVTRGILPDKKADISYIGDVYAAVPKKFVPRVRYISAALFPFKNEITIYAKNKVSIINFNKRDPAGIVIEDESIHGMMRMTFELAWHGAKEVKKKKTRHFRS